MPASPRLDHRLVHAVREGVPVHGVSDQTMRDHALVSQGAPADHAPVVPWVAKAEPSAGTARDWSWLGSIGKVLWLPVTLFMAVCGPAGRIARSSASTAADPVMGAMGYQRRSIPAPYAPHTVHTVGPDPRRWEKKA